MTRLLLKAWNAPGLILLAIIGIAIQGSLFQTDILRFFKPDVILFLVIWVSLKRDFTEGGILTLILASIAEVHSSVPEGTFLICYMTLYLLIRLCNRLLIVWSLLPMTLAATFIFKVELLLILKFVDASDIFWSNVLTFIPPALVIQGLLSRWVYRSLSIYDRITFKDPAAVQAMESGFSPEEEGL